MTIIPSVYQLIGAVAGVCCICLVFPLIGRAAYRLVSGLLPGRRG